MKCSRCHYPVESEWSVCPKCGMRLAQAAPPPAPVPAPPEQPESSPVLPGWVTVVGMVACVPIIVGVFAFVLWLLQALFRH